MIDESRANDQIDFSKATGLSTKYNLKATVQFVGRKRMNGKSLNNLET